MKRKNKKKHIVILIGVVIFMLLIIAGIWFFVLRTRRVNAMGSVPALCTTASTGNIATTVIGTGTLANESAIEITIPEGITVKEVLVEAGDTVKEGDILATLDQASLLKKLSSIQEEMEEVDEEINEVKGDKASKYVKTYVSGRVKKIYAEEAGDVTGTMSEYGALLLLSLDGKMSVEMENTLSISVGDTVTVTRSDGETVEGTVESTDNGSCVITITDNGPELEEEITVQDDEGRELGSGKISIHQQLEITGTAGTVSSIQVSENEKVTSEETLIKLTDVPDSAEYQELLAERTQLAETLKELTVLSSQSSIKAEFTGTIQSVNITGNTTTQSGGTSETTAGGNGMTTTVSETETGFTITQTGGTTATSSAGGNIFTFASMTTDKKSESRETKAAATDISDMTALFQELAIAAPGVSTSPLTVIQEQTGYTGTISWNPSDGFFAAATVYTATVELQSKTGYRFAISDGTALSYPEADQTWWEISNQSEENTLKLILVFPATDQVETEPQSESETQKQTESESQKQSETQKQSESETDKSETKTTSGSGDDGSSTSDSGLGGSSSGGSSLGGSGSTSSSGTAATTATAETTEESSVESKKVTAFTISGNDSMLLSVNIDELDILSIEAGQKAVLTLDALEGQEFEGEISKINTTATSSGGVTKYTVEITVPKNESMLAGMNASATITIESKENIILLPADAIQERGDKTFVYTEEGEDGSLAGEVEVETGISDGNNVEITSGLAADQTVYYIKAAVEESTSDEKMMMGGGMMGDQMNGGNGERPSGMSGGEPPSGGFGGQ